MKKGFKSFISLILILVMVVSMTACTGKPANTDEGTNTNDSNASDATNTDVSDGSNNSNNESKNEYPEFVLNETDTTVTYLNTFGDEMTVTKNPKKVAVLLNSILDVWYLAGGEAIAKVDGTTNVPDAAMDIANLGSFNKVNLESLLALEPDLVIMTATTGTQVDMIDTLKDNGIESAIIDANKNPYESFKMTLYLFSKILGTEDAYSEVVKNVTEKCDEILEKTNAVENQPTVAIIFSSTKSVSCESPISLTGDMVKHLGAKNILDDVNFGDKTKVDFSMERLIEKDPEYILVTVMGDVDQCKKRFEDEVVANDAWGSLTAVKEGRVHYLPKELFTYKPNGRYMEAFYELGKILYPEVIK